MLIRNSKLVAFYLGYLIFGGVGVLSSVGCFVLSSVSDSRWSRALGKNLIHFLFKFFVGYLQLTGLLRLRWIAEEKLRTPCLLVANHPSIMDVVFIASGIRNVVCITKAKLLHNIVLCGQAQLAGYINNVGGVRMVRTCRRRLREGSVLIFPEGTRSIGTLNPFKMGFAVIAHAERVPIQTLILTYDQPFMGKGWGFFKPPQFPVVCTIRLGKQFLIAKEGRPQAAGAEVEEYVRDEIVERRLVCQTENV